MSELIFSPGLDGVIAGETAISSIEGGLSYRGYAVEELADRSSFEEVAFLLLHGELPTSAELAEFVGRLGRASQVAPELLELLKRLPPDTSMMDGMRSGASLLAHWDPQVSDNSPAATLQKAERLTAQLPVILAARHRLRSGKEVVAPDSSLPFSANLLWMLTGEPPSPRAARALDVTLILYAEHEFNASTFAGRVVTSTLSDLHSAITAAIGALKGPLHGGANEEVMRVLEEVGSPDRADSWVRSALARKVRIMGFGHRVYKTGDPRARYLKLLSAELARETGHMELEQMADTIEGVVLAEKKLPPNLDWPSARVYHYLGLPVDLYTPLFVVSRVTGWSAHVLEQLQHNRLIRPRSRYIGPAERIYPGSEPPAAPRTHGS